MEKLGFSENHTSTPKTCETCVGKTDDQLINSHGNSISTHFSISLTDENKMLTINLLAAWTI